MRHAFFLFFRSRACAATKSEAKKEEVFSMSHLFFTPSPPAFPLCFPVFFFLRLRVIQKTTMRHF